MKEVRYEAQPAAYVPVYVARETWLTSAARAAGALLGSAVRSARDPDSIGGVREFVRYHPFAMLAAAALGFATGRVLRRFADVLREA